MATLALGSRSVTTQTHPQGQNYPTKRPELDFVTRDDYNNATQRTFLLLTTHPTEPVVEEVFMNENLGHNEWSNDNDDDETRNLNVAPVSSRSLAYLTTSSPRRRRRRRRSISLPVVQSTTVAMIVFFSIPKRAAATQPYFYFNSFGLPFKPGCCC